jgi:hypothetical protein
MSCLSGWTESSFEDYQQSYVRFGGSILSNPQILSFFHTHATLNERYFIRRDRTGNLAGAVCVWNNKFIAGDQCAVKKHGLQRYPLNFDEIVLPINPAVKCILPFRTKFLSDINYPSIRNSSHRLNAHREVSIVRPVSAKTRSSRNRELRKFTDAGGSVHRLSEYSLEQQLQMYSELFYQRRDKHIEIKPMQELLAAIPNLLFGNILAFKNTPCAMQLVVKKEDCHRIYLDYVNAGMNTKLSNLSVGTLAAWINIREAMEYGEAQNKQVRFSFGRPTADYKDRWCDREQLYRILA